ncbi:probable serine/threonine-protein kinase DDB_G0267686 [Penaeus japonicus]|uniref:probable serine/threonine-protein kinase DDB_G0267686 n=1 Tax=Penaeus japonicus TaxID=27405 RepID=UPI001C71260D|nr:probable serine/threonine-protein kinase DDB_G0267686 [Penaeus japonicus]
MVSPQSRNLLELPPSVLPSLPPRREELPSRVSSFDHKSPEGWSRNASERDVPWTWMEDEGASRRRSPRCASTGGGVNVFALMSSVVMTVQLMINVVNNVNSNNNNNNDNNNNNNNNNNNLNMNTVMATMQTNSNSNSAGRRSLPALLQDFLRRRRRSLECHCELPRSHPRASRRSSCHDLAKCSLRLMGRHEGLEEDVGVSSLGRFSSRFLGLYVGRFLKRLGHTSEDTGERSCLNYVPECILASL